nr:PREDICTED: gastrula zinc finger protein XlCGF48.2-like [Bemisia tabaci]
MRQKLTCLICGNLYKNEAFLQVHRKTHETEGNYCELCGRIFHLRSTLQWHIRNEHDIISSRFFFSEQVDTVIEHGGMRNFSCSDCGACYKNADSLRAHRKTHTGETYCQLCRKTLSTRFNLRMHMISAHKICLK